MREFTADRKVGKKLYKRCRKNYKRYRVGSIITLILIAAIVIFDAMMVSHGENAREMAEIMIVCLCFDIVFFIVTAIVWAAAVSGGRDVLMNRLSEKCTFYDDRFEIEYVPNPAVETSEFKRIVFKMPYGNVTGVSDEVRERGKLVISGRYEILKYRSSDMWDSKVERTVEYNLPISIYAYYIDFEEMYREFSMRLGRML